MPKLETQINQIFLLHPEIKTASLVLYDEQLSSSCQLFLLAELRPITKKTEADDLKKLSEIILQTFRANKKLAAGALFESSLAQINQNFADTAVRGRKSWLGKFSSSIALKTSDSVYLANTGSTSCWLKRRDQLTEILKPEKNKSQPLKIFQNFTLGKLKDADGLILTTSNLFNFISLELFNSVLKNNSIKQAAQELSKLLKDSAGTTEVFASFLLHFGKEPMPETGPQPEEEKMLYAPLPETEAITIKREKIKLNKFFTGFRNLRFALPRTLPRLKRFHSLSPAGKFFLISFVIFIALFAINLAVGGIRSANEKQQTEINDQIALLSLKLTETESALIYNNSEQAVKLLRQAQEAFERLNEIAPEQAQIYQADLTDLANRINKISFVENPKIIADLTYNPAFLVPAGNGVIMVNAEGDAVSFFEQELKDSFLLNDAGNPITGLTHVSGLGNFLVTQNRLYRINENQNQLDLMAELTDKQLTGLEFFAPARIYSVDKTANQILRFVLNNGAVSAPQEILNSRIDLARAVDLGIDGDIYVLFPNGVKKTSRGNEQQFNLSELSDPLAAASRIFVGANLYVLEPGKKRIIIYDKSGKLVNQIYFPNARGLADFTINENQRTIRLLDENHLQEITF